MVRTRARARLEASLLASNRQGDANETPDAPSQREVAPHSTQPNVEELIEPSTGGREEGGGEERLMEEPAGGMSSESRQEEEEEEGSASTLPSKLLLQVEPETMDAVESCSELSSSLQPGGLGRELYFSMDPADVLSSASRARSMLLEMDSDLLKKSVITPDFEKREVAPPISQSRYTLQKLKKAARGESAGKQWFDMPAPQLTPELRNDLKLLKMRGALDPSRHYKANDSKELPRYFQVGKVVSGPADYYSSRLPRKQQKQTLVDELLANEEFTKYRGRKYSELQRKFQSGRKRLHKIKHKKNSKR